MKLKAKLGIAGALPLAAAILILTAFIATSHILDRYRADVAAAAQIVKKASDLNFLTDRLLVFREPELVPFWLRKHNEFQELVAQSRFQGPYSEYLHTIAATSQDLGSIVTRLARSMGTPSQEAVVRQMEQRLTAAILTTAREVASQADHLEAETQQELKNLQARVEVAVVALFVIVAGITAIAGIPAIVTLSSGFGKLEEGARRLAAGDYDARLEPMGDDEIGALAATFNTMAARVQEARRELLADLSNRTRMEEAVRKSEKLLRDVLDSVPVGIRLVDTAGTISYRNSAAEAIWGSGLTLESTLAEVDSFRYRTDVPVVVQSLAVMRCMARGQMVPAEMIDVVRDSGVRRTILHGGVPLFSPTGEVTGAVAVDDDVTDQVRLQEELSQSQRIQSIGLLAGGIAHDFNNIIMGIQGFTEVVHDMTDDPDAKEMLTAVLASSARAADLTRKLLAFGRRQLLEMQTIELRSLLKAVTTFASRVIPEDIAVVTEVDGDLHVTGDPGQLEQVLINLLLNARDALSPGGRIEFRARRVRLCDGEAEGLELDPERDYVCIAVADNGTGIPAEILPNIFEPFFTTKEMGKGTGLGLAMVYGIVKQHEGAISVESTVGEGTRFLVFIPADESEVPAGEKEAAPVPAGRGNILLVEDDGTVRHYLNLVLSGAGYRVTLAGDGNEGLACFNRGTFDLVVTDLIMPGMNGTDMAAVMAADRPHTRFVFLSGYSEDVLDSRGFPRNARILQKPVNRRELLGEIAQMLQVPE